MKSDSSISEAKARLASALRAHAWYSGIGIGRVSSAIGLVISVRQGARADAERVLEGIEVDCPIDIREVSVIRPRGSHSKG